MLFSNYTSVDEIATLYHPDTVPESEILDTDMSTSNLPPSYEHAIDMAPLLRLHNLHHSHTTSLIMSALTSRATSILSLQRALHDVSDFPAFEASCVAADVKDAITAYLFGADRTPGNQSVLAQVLEIVREETARIKELGGLELDASEARKEVEVLGVMAMTCPGLLEALGFREGGWWDCYFGWFRRMEGGSLADVWYEKHGKVISRHRVSELLRLLGEFRKESVKIELEREYGVLVGAMLR